MDTQTVPYQHGVLLGWGKLSVGVSKKKNSFFYPFFKPLKLPFKFTCTPSLSRGYTSDFLLAPLMRFFSNFDVSPAREGGYTCVKFW